MIDKNYNAYSSLKASWQLTTGKELHVLIISLILIFINLLGLILIIGIFITIPISCIITAKYFRLIIK